MNVRKVLLDMNPRAVRFMRSSQIPLLTGLAMLLIGAPAYTAGVGELAPEIEIETRDGTVFRLSDYRGQKPVYVVFWNTWCSYCIKKTPRYRKLQEQFGEQIEIIAINTTWSDSVDEVRSFEERYNLNYPVAYDTGTSVTDDYGVFNVPTEFIVDLDGVIRYRDDVPEYVAAHLPDWLLTYVPSEHTAASVCTP